MAITNRGLRRRIFITLLLCGTIAYTAILKNNNTEKTIQMVKDQIQPNHKKRSFSSVQELKEAVLLARKEMTKQLLRPDYGEYTDILFERKFIESEINPSGKDSLKRLKRRMKIKILHSILHSHNKNETWTWVTAGHSAAAGHGNLFNQTYTAIIQETVEGVFSSVGLQFHAKNYAMGGMASAPELALCMTAIYGTDIDILSWDFGMTDNRHSWKYALFAHRASVHPTKPSLFTMGWKKSAMNTKLEQHCGLSTFHIQWNHTMLPDCSIHEHPQLLPRAVRWYKCGTTIENAEPCKQHKWDTKRYCPSPVKYQTNWHNGWHDHLFIGRSLGVYLIHILIDAILELDPTTLSSSSSSISDTNIMKPSLSMDYLHYLQSIENADRSQYSDETKNFSSFLDIMGGGNSKFILGLFESLDPKISTKLLYEPSICHSALLPSQARFDGLVTAKDDDGLVEGRSFGGGHYIDFDRGVNYIDMIPAPKSGGDDDDDDDDIISPPLVYFDTMQHNCDELLEIDYKDFFAVRQVDGWMMGHYPTRAELDKLGISTSSSRRTNDSLKKGVIMICTLQCGFGKCPKDYIHINNETLRGSSSMSDDNNNNGTNALTIQINDVFVTGIQSIHDYCSILLGGDDDDDTTMEWPLTALQQQLEIKFHVGQSLGMLYISSIIVIAS